MVCHMHFICLSFFLDLPFACIWGPYVHPKNDVIDQTIWFCGELFIDIETYIWQWKFDKIPQTHK